MTEIIRAIDINLGQYEKQVLTLQNGRGTCEWVEIDYHEYNRIRHALARFEPYVDGDYIGYDIDMQREEVAAADHEAWCAQMDENATRGQGWL